MRMRRPGAAQRNADQTYGQVHLIAPMGKRVATVEYEIPWRYDERLAPEHLGSQKYSSSSRALGELVANGFDSCHELPAAAHFSGVVRDFGDRRALVLVAGDFFLQNHGAPGEVLLHSEDVARQELSLSTRQCAHCQLKTYIRRGRGAREEVWN